MYVSPSPPFQLFSFPCCKNVKQEKSLNACVIQPRSWSTDSWDLTTSNGRASQSELSIPDMLWRRCRNCCSHFAVYSWLEIYKQWAIGTYSQVYLYVHCMHRAASLCVVLHIIVDSVGASDYFRLFQYRWICFTAETWLGSRVPTFSAVPECDRHTGPSAFGSLLPAKVLRVSFHGFALGTGTKNLKIGPGVHWLTNNKSGFADGNRRQRRLLESQRIPKKKTVPW